MKKNHTKGRYLNYVKRHYHAKGEEREYFFNALEDSLNCYMDENPEATFQDLCVRFGTKSDLPDKAPLSRKILFVRFVKIAMAACLILGLTCGYREYLSAYETRNGYFLQQEFDSDDPPKTVNKNEPVPIDIITKTVTQDTISPESFNMDLLSTTKEHTLSYYDCNGKLCWKMSLVSSFKAEKNWGYVARYHTPTLYIYDEGWKIVENESSISDGKTNFNVTMKKGDLELYGYTTIFCNKFGAVNAKCFSGRVNRW